MRSTIWARKAQHKTNQFNKLTVLKSSAHKQVPVITINNPFELFIICFGYEKTQVPLQDYCVFIDLKVAVSG